MKKGLTIPDLLIFKKWTICTYHKCWFLETSDSLSSYRTNTWITFVLFILRCLPYFHFCKTGMWACSQHCTLHSHPWKKKKRTKNNRLENFEWNVMMSTSKASNGNRLDSCMFVEAIKLDLLPSCMGLCTDYNHVCLDYYITTQLYTQSVVLLLDWSVRWKVCQGDCSFDR